MITPVRIQRRRGADMHAESRAINGLECRYVGPGTAFGNPFKIGIDGTPEECVRKYLEWLLPYSHHGPRNNTGDFLLSEANLTEIQRELRGKNLSCWCPLSQACHASVLLKLANPLCR